MINNIPYRKKAEELYEKSSADIYYAV